MSAEMSITITVFSVIIAIIGCVVGLAGWLGGRDKHVAADAEWRGSVNAKLDVIVGIKTDVESIKATLSEHGEKLATVDASAKQAHHRIDEINKKISNE